MIKKLFTTVLLISFLKCFTDEQFLEKLRALRKENTEGLILKAQDQLLKTENNYEYIKFSAFQDSLLKIYTNYDMDDLLEINHKIDKNQKINDEEKFVYHFKFFIHLYYSNPKHKFYRISLEDLYKIIKDKSFLEFIIDDAEKNGISNELEKDDPQMKMEEI